MENPDASRAGKELVEFSWQKNHMNYYGCFSLRFYLENDMPVMTGWFPSQDGVAVRENGKDAFSNQIPWQLTWVQWFALQNLLAETELPAYRKLPPGTWDETDSKICVVWRAGDEMVTEKRNGRNADALETLALRIAEEAYTAAQLEAELHGFRSGRKRGCQCLIGGRTLLQECIGSRPLTVEVARKSNVPHTVCILFFQQTKGDRNIFGTIVNVRKDMAMKVCHASSSVCTECFSLPLCCFFDVRLLFLAADSEMPSGGGP